MRNWSLHLLSRLIGMKVSSRFHIYSLEARLCHTASSNVLLLALNRWWPRQIQGSFGHLFSISNFSTPHQSASFSLPETFQHDFVSCSLSSVSTITFCRVLSFVSFTILCISSLLVQLRMIWNIQRMASLTLPKNRMSDYKSIISISNLPLLSFSAYSWPRWK